MPVSVLFGIFALYAFTPSPRVIRAEEANGQILGEYVQVNGMVHNIAFSSFGVSFQLNDETGGVKCFIYASIVKNLILEGKDISTLSNGDFVTISGTLKEYKNEYEIVPRSTHDVII